MNRTIEAHCDFDRDVAQRKPKFREENQRFAYGRVGQGFFSAPHTDSTLKDKTTDSMTIARWQFGHSLAQCKRIGAAGTSIFDVVSGRKPFLDGCPPAPQVRAR